MMYFCLTVVGWFEIVHAKFKGISTGFDHKYRTPRTGQPPENSLLKVHV